MKIGRRIVWIVMLAGQPFTLAGGDPGKFTLTVRVHDYAALPGLELHNAMKVAQSLFRGAGIEIRWVECWPVLKSGEPLPGCGGSLGATRVLLNIVRRPLEGCGDESLGCAVQPVTGNLGIIAYVFQRRLEEIAWTDGSARFHVLGLVMAHELGHLLLGTDAHSNGGIMQPHWSVQQMATPSAGVHFSLGQARLMRSRMDAGEDVR